MHTHPHKETPSQGTESQESKTQETQSQRAQPQEASARDMVRTYLEGLDERLQRCQSSVEKMEETLESLPWKNLKEMQLEIAAQLEKKYISRVDLQHTLYGHSLKKAEQRLKRHLLIGVVTMPFISLLFLWGLACLMDAFK